MQPTSGSVQPQLLQPVFQKLGGIGRILEQLGILAEANQKRQVLGTQNRAEELARGPVFGVDQPFLAPADVHQQANGKREVRFAREVLDLLLFPVFEQVEVALVQV